MNPWLDPTIPAQMRAKADQDFAAPEMPIHFRAFAESVRDTQCPGTVLEVGCGPGHGREILDRCGVAYASYTGCDINPAAIALAKERYPESRWVNLGGVAGVDSADVVIDGSCVLHVDDWRLHLKNLCQLSRRWVILHRLPCGKDNVSSRAHTSGYGHHFPAWTFARTEVIAEMAKHGFEPCGELPADGGSVTLTFARPRQYVTYADEAYLPRLKALHASLVRHCGPFQLNVLAWGESVFNWCVEAPHVLGVKAEDWIKAHPGLIKENLPGPKRTKVEHYWTCGPQWIADVMDDTGEPVTYLDADLLMMSSPEPVFAEIGGAPAGVVPHGFARAAQGLPGPTAETHEVFGKYNVGLIHFNNSIIARAWAAMCRTWCHGRLERLENGAVIYGDQAYLSSWPEYHGAHVIQHPGACLGPWAVHTRALEVRDGVIHFGGRPLISYHFSGMRELPDGHSVASRPEYQVSRRQEDILYAPYYRALREAK